MLRLDAYTNVAATFCCPIRNKNQQKKKEKKYYKLYPNECNMQFRSTIKPPFPFPTPTSSISL